MDDTLAGFLIGEQIVAARLFRLAKAVHAAYLGGSDHGAGLDLPPPCGISPESPSDPLEKIATQDPSLKLLTRAILADDRRNAASKVIGGESHWMSLLHWWAAFGDFEIWLKRCLGDDAKEHRQRRTLFGRSQQAGTTAQLFQDARVSVIRGEGGTSLHTLHPINWYVACVSKPVWAPYVDCGAVGEVLGLHAAGGWLTPQDVLIDFYDAVTRAAAARFVSAFATRGVTAERPTPATDFAQSLRESASVFGLSLEPCDPCGVEVTMAPSGAWPEQAGKVRLRHEARVGGRPILPISACARPRAYVRVPGERPDWSARTGELIEHANQTWTDQERFGTWLAAVTKEPIPRAEDAIGALGGLLGRALAPSENGIETFSERRFIGELRRVLVRHGVAVVRHESDSDSGSRRIGARFSRDGHWALKVDAGQLTIPLGMVHKAACPDSVFTAIEPYDDYVWSCIAVADVSCKPEWVRAKEALLASGAWGTEWERVKLQLLNLPTNPTAEQLRAPFEATHKICIRLQASPEHAAPQSNTSAMASVVVRRAHRRLRDVVSAVVTIADACGPDVIGGFYPPRHSAGLRAGDVDLGRWLEDPWWTVRRVAGEGCDIRLRRAESVAIQAGPGNAGNPFTVSLPFASDADETLSACPGAILWLEEREPPTYVRAIHECLRPSLQAIIDKGGAVDFTEALGSLRSRFASEKRSDTFHDLVDQAVRGDAIASACLSRLQSDKRFQVPCFPAVVEVDGRWQVKPPAPSDKEASWQFSGTPQGQTVELRFAMIAENATRVISRGPDEGTGLQALAAGIAEWSRSLPDSIGSHARLIVRCSDRHETFREPLDEGIKAAVALLMVITGAGDKGGSFVLETAQRDAGFQRLKSWLHAAGAVVEPADWTAGAGAQALPEGAEESPPVFCEDVPEGSLVVEEFAVKTPAGSRYGTFRGCRSAGRPPSNYQDLLTLASVPDGELFLEWLKRLPAKKLKGGDAFRSDLYDLYYKISMGHYNCIHDRELEWNLPLDVFAKAKQCLEEMYESAFECEAFPPKEQAVVKVFAEVGPDEVQLLEPGQPEGAVHVVVRGFKSQGKLVKARVYKEPAP